MGIAWTEWDYVFRRMAEGRAPSREHLARLVALPGIPGSATEEQRKAVYRILKDGPGEKPFPEPDDWELFGEYSARDGLAYMDLLHLHNELAEFATSEPGPSRRAIVVESLSSEGPEPVTIQLRYVKGRGEWRVRDPRGQAREIVARRYCMSPATLADFERRFRTGPRYGKLGQVF
jgi:hypothetical protein